MEILKNVNQMLQGVKNCKIFLKVGRKKKKKKKRSEEPPPYLPSHFLISFAVFFLKKKKKYYYCFFFFFFFNFLYIIIIIIITSFIILPYKFLYCIYSHLTSPFFLYRSLTIHLTYKKNFTIFNPLQPFIYIFQYFHLNQKFTLASYSIVTHQMYGQKLFQYRQNNYFCYIFSNQTVKHIITLYCNYYKRLLAELHF
eukprot:TRINITY_DN4406_c0_g1_i10.p1 TRINITY_DN4406_c0_g1~~TRINITY_DN4406_c0_g1_i10.p1  ORF type:complete len:197 (-),score=-15.55 TRINITY_DN4406_c0_g1_i10:398-988(-)